MTFPKTHIHPCAQERHRRICRCKPKSQAGATGVGSAPILNVRRRDKERLTLTRGGSLPEPLAAAPKAFEQAHSGSLGARSKNP